MAYKIGVGREVRRHHPEFGRYRASSSDPAIEVHGDTEDEALRLFLDAAARHQREQKRRQDDAVFDAIKFKPPAR